MHLPAIGLLTAIVAYTLLAFSAVGDKFLVTKAFRNPYSYAIIIAFLSLGLFIFVPPGVSPTTLFEWTTALVAGAFSTIALVLYYTALQESDASSLLPVVGAMSIIFTGFLAFIFIDERLRATQFIAVVLLVLGFVVLTYGKRLISRRALLFGIAASIVWAISNVAIKMVFSFTPFIAGLAYSRLGAVAVAVCLLAFPRVRMEFKSNIHFRMTTVIFMVINGAIGASGEIIKYFSVSLISPTIVNAIQGLLYAIIFLIGVAVTHIRPDFLTEKVDHPTLVRKGIGISFIIAGLVALAVL